jgi:hypothetical protein
VDVGLTPTLGLTYGTKSKGGMIRMKRFGEMNYWEKEGVKRVLIGIGWGPCQIGNDHVKGWSFKKITVAEKDMWFEE